LGGGGTDPSPVSQKLVSNLVIRNQNAIALQCLTKTDAALYASSSDTVATFADDGQVPLLTSLQPGAAASAGMHIARNLAYIQQRSYAAVLASSAGSLPELMTELAARGPVYGAQMPWGFWDLSSLLPLRYVTGLLIYAEAQTKQMMRSASKAPHKKDTVAIAMRGDQEQAPESRSAHQVDHVLDQLADYDRHFFAMKPSERDGHQLPAYKLPSTFYMSTYRSAISSALL